ncbi:hypothetical protein FEM48_Zijuj02G0206700 [Ziziphus jujuba var. spinosa]|uniref:Uncharacterized protein n=1 Tax=Ziziphus jujuba var. spinosa TaxID=714518 RepID=A0A978VXV7_ZIZJJ|nr:hypothetical protein FEM48_Zijuj02G0206700 [Ziziphus jujuba var. spinosa]
MMFGVLSCWLPLKLIINMLIILLLLKVTSPSTEPDVEVEALVDFLRALNDSKGQITDWNYNLVSPCFSWSRVTCRNGNVISLSLASNGFSGTLSPSITKLKYLASLDLSSTNLSGRIPVKLFSVLTFNFTGTHLACGSGLDQPCVSNSSFQDLQVSTSKSKFEAIVTSSSCAALFVIVLVGALFTYQYYHVHKHKHDVFVDVEDYHSPGGEAAFLREVQLISVAVHRNLLRLIGFCTTSSERILVYPFMQNLSVAYRLREKTDVFGYGITLLELVTGQRAIDFSRLEEEEDVLLLDHTKKLQRENRLQDIVDGNLNTYDPKEVETIVQVALLCTQTSPEDRPMMVEVVKMLQGVGLSERWAEWEQLEQVRNQEFYLYSHQFALAEDSTHDQEAIQLSKAR